MNRGLRTASYPCFALEVPHEEDGDAYGEEECKGEAPRGGFHAVDEIHAEETGDEGREHEDDADAGEHLHDGAHVVVDDVGIGVHRGVENVGIDVGGLACLAHLDADVFYHVCVEFVDGQFELQLGEEVFVAADGGDEVGEAVLQSAQGDEVGVADVAVEVLLGLVDECADLLEPLQVPDCTAEEEAEYHVNGIDESESALLLIGDEVNHHVCLEVADGDEDVAFHDDTEGNGGVGGAAFCFLDVWDTQDDEHPAFVDVVAGTFIGIGDVADVVVGDVEGLFQEVDVFLGGAGDLHPAAGLPFANGTQTIRSVPVCSHRLGSSSF